MRKLSINTQKDLQEFKKTFKEEYKLFFNQELKTSKVEAFIAKLAGAKNFNTLFGSLTSHNFKTWEEAEWNLSSHTDYPVLIETIETPPK